jgi:hypothetical protein
MIYKFYNFLLEKQDKKEKLVYYVFDWDDNILYMPTMIHMQYNKDGKWIDESVTTKKFSLIRGDDKWRYKDNDVKKTFCDFGDHGLSGKNKFKEDIQDAIKNKKFGPEWKTFINCMINGNIFMIVTARSHGSESMKTAIEWIIFNYLNDNQQDEMLNNIMSFYDIFNKNIDFVIEQYINSCEYWAVGDPINNDVKKFSFKKNDTIEVRKYKMIKNFKERLEKYGNKINRNLNIKYSQDDEKIVSTIKKYMGEEKKLSFMNQNLNIKTEYHVTNTSNPLKIKTTKI